MNVLLSRGRQEQSSVLTRPQLPATAASALQTTVAILTGGQDKSYVVGLVTALAAIGMRLDVIGSDEVESPDICALPTVRFLNLRGSQRRGAPMREKLARVARYYARLVRYAAKTQASIFHILWNNKIEWFDRTVLMLYYKLCGKKVVLTAHNVNGRKRDGSDTLFNRLTLRCQYHLCDHLFVHTDKMKEELVTDFGVGQGRVTVIPFGMNSTVRNTPLTRGQARERLGVGDTDKTILFFGRIVPYKGLEFLVAAFQRIAGRNPDYRLIIAGKPKAENETYAEDICRMIANGPGGDQIIQRMEFIRDDDTEVYFKGADVIVLPYKDICQTGVLFLAYNFGLPAVATDVGAFREDIVQGETGFLCRPCDSASLAGALQEYFASDLFKELDMRRSEIRQYANVRHSWETVGDMTRTVYSGLLARQ